MKKQQIVELHTKEAGELKRMLENLQKELSDLEHEMAVGQAKNTAAKKTKKKDIARIVTILSMKKEVKNA